MTSRRSSLQKIGPLEVIQTAGEESSPCLIIFHGFGADAYDLAPLAQEIAVPEGTGWMFPNGPLQVPIGPGFTGRAWFPINMDAHQRAAMLGEEIDYSKIYPPGMSEAKDKALSMLQQTGIEPERMILGGFSQGSMLALEVAINLPQPPKGLVILSGSLVDRAGTLEKAKAHLKGVPFFQSHGQIDQVLPHAGARRLEAVLTEAGLKGKLETFSGGHEIPFPVIQSVSSFLHKIIG